MSRNGFPSPGAVLACLLSLLVAAGTARAQTADAAAEDALTAECRRILDGAGTRRPESVAAALAARGPAVTERLLLLHAEGGGAERRTAVVLALKAIQGRDPAPWLVTIATAPGEESRRLAALDLLRECAASHHLPALLGLIAGGDRDIRRAAERAAVAAIGRLPERTLSDVLRGLFDSTPQALRLHLAECVLLSSRSASMPFLARLLGRDRTMDLLVLTGLGRMTPGDDSGALLAGLRGFLGDPDPAFRRGAAQALGQLMDPESAGALVGLLSDTSEGVSATAWWALRNLSGLDFPADPARWRMWFETEKAWWDGEGKRLVADLGSSDPAKVVEAVRGLSLSSLHRREVTALLAGLRESDHEVVRDLVEAVLGRRGQPRAAADAPAGGDGLAWFSDRTRPAQAEDRPPAARKPPERFSRSGTLIAAVIGGGICLVMLLRLLGISRSDRHRIRRKPVAEGPMTVTIRHDWSKPARSAAPRPPAPAPEVTSGVRRT